MTHNIEFVLDEKSIIIESVNFLTIDMIYDQVCKKFDIMHFHCKKKIGFDFKDIKLDDVIMNSEKYNKVYVFTKDDWPVKKIKSDNYHLHLDNFTGYVLQTNILLKKHFPMSWGKGCSVFDIGRSFLDIHKLTSIIDVLKDSKSSEDNDFLKLIPKYYKNKMGCFGSVNAFIAICRNEEQGKNYLVIFSGPRGYDEIIKQNLFENNIGDKSEEEIKENVCEANHHINLYTKISRRMMFYRMFAKYKKKDCCVFDKNFSYISLRDKNYTVYNGVFSIKEGGNYFLFGSTDSSWYLYRNISKKREDLRSIWLPSSTNTRKLKTKSISNREKVLYRLSGKQIDDDAIRHNYLKTDSILEKVENKISYEKKEKLRVITMVKLL